MPCPQVTVGFRQELLTTSIEVVFVPRRGLMDSIDQRVAFHMASHTGLSPFPARCYCHQHVFVPRNDVSYAICQVYEQIEKLSNGAYNLLCHHISEKQHSNFSS